MGNMDLYAISGTVQNEITPALLQEVVSLLKSRDFIYMDKCPKITKDGIEYK